MRTDLMEGALHGSQAGNLKFPEVVGMMIEAGVESYCADYVKREDTFYMPDGQTFVLPMQLPPVPIAGNFSPAALLAAIRGAQRDEVRYPEFLRLSLAAGVVAYRVFVTGRRAVYWGRKGEMHVEEFPRS